MEKKYDLQEMNDNSNFLGAIMVTISLIVISLVIIIEMIK
tara:strand:- start:1010 stop:1129 length:120 start_codon:yes stop_codon:yes gene_type:complete